MFGQDGSAESLQLGTYKDKTGLSHSEREHKQHILNVTSEELGEFITRVKLCLLIDWLSVQQGNLGKG